MHFLSVNLFDADSEALATKTRIETTTHSPLSACANYSEALATKTRIETLYHLQSP